MMSIKQSHMLSYGTYNHSAITTDSKAVLFKQVNLRNAYAWDKQSMDRAHNAWLLRILLLLFQGQLKAHRIVQCKSLICWSGTLD